MREATPQNYALCRKKRQETRKTQGQTLGGRGNTMVADCLVIFFPHPIYHERPVFVGRSASSFCLASRRVSQLLMHNRSVTPEPARRVRDKGLRNQTEPIGKRFAHMITFIRELNWTLAVGAVLFAAIIWGAHLILEEMI